MKRDNKKDKTDSLIGKTGHWHLLFFLLFSLSACYQPVKDCLDINATNFNANADDPCDDDCCKYPTLSFTINHLMGEESLVYADSIFYDNGSSDSIRIAKIIFYLSDIEVFGPDSNFSVSEQVATQLVDGGSALFADDFTLVEYNKGRNYRIGTYQTTGTYDRVLFRLGLNDSVSEVNPLLMEEDHALSIQSDSMWRENDGYALAQVSVVSQANNMDTLDYFIPNLHNSILMGGFTPLNIDFGENSTISLEVDYLKWLAGIDFVAIGDNHDLVVSKIVNQLSESISVSK